MGQRAPMGQELAFFTHSMTHSLQKQWPHAVVKGHLSSSIVSMQMGQSSDIVVLHMYFFYTASMYFD
jgi:hypothetical protein